MNRKTVQCQAEFLCINHLIKFSIENRNLDQKMMDLNSVHAIAFSHRANRECVMAELEDAVSKRLRAVMSVFQITTNVQMAEVCGSTKSAVNNWMLGYNLPRVPDMMQLCERTGITLDWLYRGVVVTMDQKLALTLSRHIDSQ